MHANIKQMQSKCVFIVTNALCFLSHKLDFNINTDATLRAGSEHEPNIVGSPSLRDYQTQSHFMSFNICFKLDLVSPEAHMNNR